MEALLIALQAAAVLAPMLESTVSTLGPAIAPESPAPLSAGQADKIIADLETAVRIAPAIAGLIPLVKQAFAGKQMNDTDLANLKAAADAIDAAVAAKAGEIEAG